MEILNRSRKSRAEKIAIRVFREALDAVDPVTATGVYCRQIRDYLSREDFETLYLVGFGKASCTMLSAAISEMGIDAFKRCAIVTKYGHVHLSMGDQLIGEIRRKVSIHEAGHPVPDHNGILGTAEIIDALREADERSLVLSLISGGGSALLVAPFEGITLNDKQDVTERLLRAGADIYELNTVRKHLSRVKGGRLAEIAYPAEVISLIVSDVIGDRLDVIASGPTAPDPTTYGDAIGVLKKYGLYRGLSESVVSLLEKGREGLIPETPKPGGYVFKRVQNLIIGSNRIALEAASESARSLGLHTEIITTELKGEAREAGRFLAEKAKERLSVIKGPACLISGGETTVTVKGNGRGGRNTELALAFAIEISGLRGVTLLSAGTDGTDGPTDAAGAMVDGGTISEAQKRGLAAREYLDNNDSYNFFRQIDSLLITGPTGTNVMDIQIIILGV